jgi:hypothetical protein
MRPHAGQFLHERRNGHSATESHHSFRSAAEMLDTFGTQQGRTQYSRLMQ